MSEDTVTITRREYNQLKEIERDIKRKVVKVVRNSKKVRYDWLVLTLVKFNSFINDVVTRSRERELDKAIEQVTKDKHVS